MVNRRNFLRNSALLSLAASLPVPSRAAGPGPMMKRNLPGTDESLAVIGLGNARPFAAGDLEVSRQLLDLLMERGGGYVDTSGPARFTVGQVMAERDAHEQLFLGTYIDVAELAAMRDEIRAVQEGQGGGALDLVITRSPKAMLEHGDALLRLREDGLTRHIGVGRHNKRFFPDIMKLMNEGIVDLIQINYSMLEPESAEEILPLAMEKNVAVITNRAFVNGDYFRIVKGQQLPDWAAEFDCESWAQFSLKYVLSHPAVNCALTETSNPRHAVDNFAAGYGRLPDKDMRARMLAHMRGLA